MLDYSIPTNGAALSLSQPSSNLRVIITHNKADIDRLVRILGKQPLKHLKAMDFAVNLRQEHFNLLFLRDEVIRVLSWDNKLIPVSKLFTSAERAPLTRAS
jgi:hypothetical protein